ncbi:MAG TPA: hypothetical protein VKU80_03815 [Planctomycetota bacterium]|nr:hypothetical protein [Planctomycetota bacterium]
MRTTAVLLVLGPLLLQTDPLAAARKDLGAGFSIECVEPALLLARPVEQSDGHALRDLLLRSARSYRSRILDVPAQNPLLIIVFGSAESYLSYTLKRYDGPVPQTTYYDVPNRRVLLRTEAAAAYSVQAARIYLLTDALNGNAAPPWIAASLSILDDPDADPPTFDHRAALLQEMLKRNRFPALRSFLGLDLAAFHSGETLSIHTSIALKLADYLEKKGALKRFFEEYRKSFRKDVTGAAALEAALGMTLDAIEKAFIAHLQALPWLNRPRFLEQARKVFGPDPLIQVDQDLMLAVTGNVEPRVASQALDEVKRLRGPLIRLFSLKESGLPVLARLFKDQHEFQEYARIDAPHRQWVGGYFSYDSRWLVLHLEPDSGSLAHEYCHALFEDDTGRQPAWFTEGLAQLFERFKIENGLPWGLRGSTLGPVQSALAQSRVPELTAFIGLRGQEFFGGDQVSLNYDIAHALMLYLQEKGTLVAMYKEVQKAKAANPFALPIATCRAALEKAAGATIEKIDVDFRAWLRSAKD